MSQTLTHDQLEELLPAAALEILEGDELVQVTAHLPQCPDCARLLASHREVVANLAAALPEQPFHPARSAELRARLLARTRTGRAAAVSLSASRRSPARVTRWAGWAVAAGLVGVLAVHHSIHQPVAYGWLAAGVLALVVLALGAYLWTQHGRLAALRKRLPPEQQEAADSRVTRDGPSG
jgi:anti-sigma factor RsiW